MSPELRRYLDLEQAMVALDEHGNPEADTVRDVMDLAWRDLSASDRAWINARVLPPIGAHLRLTTGDQLFIEPPRHAPTSGVTWTFDEWCQGAA